MLRKYQGNSVDMRVEITRGQLRGLMFRNSGGQQGAEHASGSPPAADAMSSSSTYNSPSGLKRQRSVAFAGANQLQDSPTKKGKKGLAKGGLGRESLFFGDDGDGEGGEIQSQFQSQGFGLRFEYCSQMDVDGDVDRISRFVDRDISLVDVG